MCHSKTLERERKRVRRTDRKEENTTTAFQRCNEISENENRNFWPKMPEFGKTEIGKDTKNTTATTTTITTAGKEAKQM